MKSLLISIICIACVVIFATAYMANEKTTSIGGETKVKPVTEKERVKIMESVQKKALKDIKQRVKRKKSNVAKPGKTPALKKALEQLRQEFIQLKIIPLKKTTETEASPKMSAPLEIAPLAPDAWCQEECLEVSQAQCTGYAEQWRLNDCNVPIYTQCYEWCLENSN